MSVPPKEDAAKLELRARPAPVTRLNRRTLMVLVGGLAAGVLLVTLWAFRTPERRDAPTRDTHNVERVTPAEGLQALPSDYRQMPMPALPRTEDEAPAPGEGVDGALAEDEAARAEQQRLQEEAAAAAKAPVFFQAVRAASSSAASAATMPVAGDTAAPGIPLMPAAPGQDADEYAMQNRQADKQAFVDAEPDSRIYGTAELQTPSSPYQLMAGTVIPAALLTAVNSDLPGQVIATVTEHVYDTLTGQHLLVPQGSRLIGQYDSQVAYGQRRVLLVWTRLIRPDGTSLVLDRLPATDAAGQSGLEDRVDWHWRRIFAGAALSTLIGVGAELAAPDRVGADGRIVIATRESVQDTVNQVGQQITRRNLDLQPALTVRVGFPVRVVVNRDLVLQ
ncbi:TrbI/VirB10 family protein [Luteimonas kalidii]|uniref:TrbI/VirB10 family protein n=1 Tax=Luteimonas kalidii TaxID=3042025 RepID=A0ABT6JXC5_9GAMM|nr:TrbI/VirB10 family protein [Luteimonas kalidii]MDH5835358.1 TrbI/VirB10 family protein [Luteimonas kalidii]